jgi:pimeloyl-ACP methyl ester carboxylesterase
MRATKTALGTLGIAGISTVAWLAAARRAGVIGVDPTTPAVDPETDPREAFSLRKRYLPLERWQVAYVDEGKGDPVVLLHGCPFHSYEWREVIPLLAPHHRVLAPDLLGLGDTVVRLDDDYRLPRDVDMVIDFLDALGIESAHFITHDHGGATALLLAERAPERIRSLVLTNIEAYDQWPSEDERKYLQLVVHPLTSPLFRALLQLPAVRREVFSIAANRREVLTDEVLDAFMRAHTSTPARWARLRRFFRWQLDRDHNAETMRVVPAIRRFDRPTLLLWGQRDGNFGEAVAHRLLDDIPGADHIEWLEDSGHMPMLEEPRQYADHVLEFVAKASTE